MTFESKPRFRDAPRQCTTANLPSHETEAAARDWHQKVNPRGQIVYVWQCKDCGGWHVRMSNAKHK